MDTPIQNDEVLDQTADLEEYARRGEKPPRCRRYRIKIDRKPYVVNQACITGREVLELAGLTPPERYTLRVAIAGQRPEKVRLDDKVDLTRKGVERFKSMPCDQTEG